MEIVNREMNENTELRIFDSDIWRVEKSVKAELGERPIWDDAKKRLIWVDVKAGRIYIHSADFNTVETLQLEVSVGAVGLSRDGGFVAATGDGFRILDQNGTTVGGPFSPPGMSEHLRFNDGYCDPAGRFWAGTTSLYGRKGEGALYYFESNGDITLAIEGVSESNGIGWSLDGAKMYYIDSGEEEVSVKAYDFDVDTARLGRYEKLIVPNREDGVPDGLVVDSDGCLWVAFWNGHSLRRYSPLGKQLEVYQLPVTNPTCPSFGGSDLCTLFVTTAWEGMTESSRLRESYAGNLLSTEMTVSGQPTSFFG